MRILSLAEVVNLSQVALGMVGHVIHLHEMGEKGLGENICWLLVARIYDNDNTGS